MAKQVWLAALTAAFIAGGMAIAQAQSAGGGGGSGGSDPSQRGAYTNQSPSPIYKDERFQPIPGRGR
jgi:hypothetical protein